EPGRDHRHLENLQRAGDIDALPARESEHLTRAVPEADLEHRNGEGAVERRIGRHRDDHVTIPHRLRTVCVTCHLAFASSPASPTARAATSGEEATRRSPSRTSTRPSRCPLATGSASATGATTRSTSGRPLRIAAITVRGATSLTAGRPYPVFASA